MPVLPGFPFQSDMLPIFFFFCPIDDYCTTAFKDQDHFHEIRSYHLCIYVTKFPSISLSLLSTSMVSICSSCFSNHAILDLHVAFFFSLGFLFFRSTKLYYCNHVNFRLHYLLLIIFHSILLLSCSKQIINQVFVGWIEIDEELLIGISDVWENTKFGFLNCPVWWWK